MHPIWKWTLKDSNRLETTLFDNLMKVRIEGVYEYTGNTRYRYQTNNIIGYCIFIDGHNATINSQNYRTLEEALEVAVDNLTAIFQLMPIQLIPILYRDRAISDEDI